jgi:hypothetical protein
VTVGDHATEAARLLAEASAVHEVAGGTSRLTPGGAEHAAYVTQAGVHATLALTETLAAFTVSLAQVTTALVAGTDHPPVPAQARDDAQQAVWDDSAHWWAGWQPGYWPMTDRRDPRGFTWADPFQEG